MTRQLGSLPMLPSKPSPNWAVDDWAPGSRRKKAERGKLYFTNLQSKENVPTMINPKPCGHLCCCVVRGCEQVWGGLAMGRAQPWLRSQGPSPDGVGRGWKVLDRQVTNTQR